MSVSNRDDGGAGFVSVQVEVLIDCKSLPPGHIDEAQAGFSHRSAAIGLSSEIEYFKDEFSPALRKVRTDHPDIARWIDFQQMALSSLAAQLDAHRAMLSDVAPQTVSISASGMEFETQQSVLVGDLLEVILSLGPSQPTILVIARVDELMAPEPADTGVLSTRLRASFSQIRESDQEVLIRHIHRTQMEQIRAAREHRSSALSESADSV